jgi:uncharacterized membrane protein YqjE
MSSLSVHELIGIFVAIFIIWVILKLAKVAIRVILFVIGLVLVLWVLYHVFS